MKKTILLVAAAAMLAGCGFMQNSTTNSASTNTQSSQATTTTVQQANTAMSAGQGAGDALLKLYNQYKADGNKYDYKNMQNMLNTVTLVANCEGLKTNFKNTDYLKQFGSGLIASSLGLVTQNNVQTVTSSLVDMVKNSETVQNAADKAQNAADKTSQYASAISALLSALKSEN